VTLLATGRLPFALGTALGLATALVADDLACAADRLGFTLGVGARSLRGFLFHVPAPALVVGDHISVAVIAPGHACDSNR
jgi:hypothetical protein